MITKYVVCGVWCVMCGVWCVVVLPTVISLLDNCRTFPDFVIAGAPCNEGEWQLEQFFVGWVFCSVWNRLI